MSARRGLRAAGCTSTPGSPSRSRSRSVQSPSEQLRSSFGGLILSWLLFPCELQICCFHLGSVRAKCNQILQNQILQMCSRTVDLVDLVDFIVWTFFSLCERICDPSAFERVSVSDGKHSQNKSVFWSYEIASRRASQKFRATSREKISGRYVTVSPATPQTPVVTMDNKETESISHF